jgi:hypothetical protein
MPSYAMHGMMIIFKGIIAIKSDSLVAKELPQCLKKVKVHKYNPKRQGIKTPKRQNAKTPRRQTTPRRRQTMTKCQERQSAKTPKKHQRRQNDAKAMQGEASQHQVPFPVNTKSSSRSTPTPLPGQHQVPFPVNTKCSSWSTPSPLPGQHQVPFLFNTKSPSQSTPSPRPSQQ